MSPELEQELDNLVYEAELHEYYEELLRDLIKRIEDEAYADGLNDGSVKLVRVTKVAQS